MKGITPNPMSHLVPLLEFNHIRTSALRLVGAPSTPASMSRLLFRHITNQTHARQQSLRRGLKPSVFYDVGSSCEPKTDHATNERLKCQHQRPAIEGRHARQDWVPEECDRVLQPYHSPQIMHDARAQAKTLFAVRQDYFAEFRIQVML